MADNLSFDITADSSKARQDLELLKAKLREARKEVTTFANEASKTGDTTKLKAAVTNVQALEKSFASLNREVKKTHEAHESFGESLLHLAHGNRPVARLMREFGNLSGGIENTAAIFGRFVGGFAGGVAALAGFKGFEILRDQLGEVSKYLAEIKERAANLNIKPIAAQAIGETAAAAGEDPKTGLDAMQKLSDQLDEARGRINAPGGTQGVEVLTGGMKALGNEIQVVGDKAVQVFRQGGATGDIKNFATSLDAIARRFPGTEEGKLQSMIAALRQSLALMKSMDATQANIFSKERFGQPAETMKPIIEAQIKLNEAKQHELELSQRGATRRRLEEEHDLKVAQADLGTQGTELQSAIANLIRPERIQLTQELAELAKGWSKILSEGLTIDWSVRLTPEAEKVFADITHAFQSFWTEMTSIATAGVADIKAIIQTMADMGSSVRGAISSAASSVGSAASSATSALMSGADTGAPFARGGYVRGPGTGTSDSILARLSSGEFVVNAAAVRRLGTSFLSGLNGFADGGLVGFPRFAAGGLVSAFGGNTHVASFHFESGKSFALSGPRSVVEAMVSEAKAQQMRSAGVKPSWYGGRPGA